MDTNQLSIDGVRAIRIPNFENEYAILEDGRLWGFPKMKGRAPIKGGFRKLHIGKGYYQAFLHKNHVIKFYKIHRLVAKTFIPNPENKPCVNHKDGNKLNNHYKNLEWVTVSENNKHADALGLSKYLPKMFSEEVVKEIQSKYIPRKYSIKKLAKEYKCSEYPIHRIVTGRYYTTR